MAVKGSAKLILGCGYLGQRLAARWSDLGCRVHVVTRSPHRAKRFRELGWEPLVADVTQPDSLPALPRVSTLLFAVGHDRQADHTMHEVCVGGLATVLHAARGQFEKIIHISSTGVYGRTDGGWVDENSACHPTRPGGAACLAAENLLRADQYAGGRSIILRLAGIYGPGRVPQRRAPEAGSFSADGVDRYLNLIHVEDAVRCCLRAEEVATTPRIFNVSDGCPVLRRAYYEYLLSRLGLPSSVFDGPIAGQHPPARRSDHKRVCNRRMFAELGVQLAYPDYRLGLAAILAGASGGEEGARSGIPDT